MGGRGRKRRPPRAEGSQGKNGAAAVEAPLREADAPQPEDNGKAQQALMAVSYDRVTGNLRVNAGDITPDEYLRIASALRADAERKLMEAYRQRGQ